MCILDIDVQGVKQIKQTSLEPRLIFVKPPSFEDLKNRLLNRGTETPESLQKRLSVAQAELEYGKHLYGSNEILGSDVCRMLTQEPTKKILNVFSKTDAILLLQVDVVVVFD